MDNRRWRDALRPAQARRRPALVQRRQFVDALVETADVGIVACDADGVLVVGNQAERAMFGLPASPAGVAVTELDAAIDVFSTDGRRMAPEEYPLLRTLRGEDVSGVEVLAGPAGGPHRHLVVRGRQITDGRGRVVGAVAALTDVTTERAAVRALAEEHHRLVDAEARLRHTATHDPLTGLPNRALALSHLEQALAGAASDGDAVAVLFVDLDGFKAVNDAAGHAAGDAVLVETAERLRRTVRAETDLVARMGGDEFVVVVSGQAAPPDRAATLARRLVAEIRLPVPVGAGLHVVRASIGVAWTAAGPASGGEPASADTLLHRADLAMYRAKQHGDGRIVVAGPSWSTGARGPDTGDVGPGPGRGAGPTPGQAGRTERRLGRLDRKSTST